MNFVFKTLCPTVALALGLSATLAHAEENAPETEDTTKARAVLFKIHDIEPVMNADGFVTECDFGITFYNRTPESIRQASVTLGWNDNISGRYMESDDKQVQEEEENRPTENYRRRDNRNNQDTLEKKSDISVTVEMPAVGGFKQVSVKSSVKTEKCFLLLDKLNYKVENCNIVGKPSDGSTRRGRVDADRAGGECASLFQYVDSKNPEYYNEFKNVSYSTLERMTDEEKSQDLTEVQESYDKVSENIKKTDELIGNIR